MLVMMNMDVLQHGHRLVKNIFISLNHIFMIGGTLQRPFALLPDRVGLFGWLLQSLYFDFCFQ